MNLIHFDEKYTVVYFPGQHLYHLSQSMFTIFPTPPLFWNNARLSLTAVSILSATQTRHCSQIAILQSFLNYFE
jgi:hypothetical protein